MTRILFRALALLLLPLAALAAPPLLLPHDGPVPKAERPRPFVSQGHRVQLNLHEIRGLRPGDEVELRLPNGKVHPLVFDLLKDEGNGITTWIGYHRRGSDKLRAVVTHGPAGSFGRIATPDGDFALVPGDGFDWLVDMVAEQVHMPLVDLGDDMRVPTIAPVKEMHQHLPLHAPEFQVAIPGVNSVDVSFATPPQVVVDLMFVYTSGYASNLGSELETRLNFLVASANTMMADSEVGIVLRLVHAVQVSYPDSGTNSAALDAITPVNSGGTGVFANIEALRTQYGADIVAFLRSGSNSGGSGIAWVANGPVGPTFARYMYSVTTGCVRFCEWVFVHELGHNMGNAHDRATAAWQAGGVASPPAGSYSYSFGYYSCNNNVLSCNPNVAGSCTSQPECGSSASGTNNFADIMAYFHGSTRRNFKFSNPSLTCSGNLGIQQACGVVEGQSSSANAALSMNQNRMALSALRATATVAPAATSTRLLSSTSSAQVSATVTLTADVSSDAGTPSGAVHFRANGNSIAGCTASTLSATARATCSTAFGSAGTFSITAEYAGNGSFAASTSAAVAVSVSSPMSTPAIALAASANPADMGQPLTFTATVSGSAGIPTGNVVFRDNGSAISGCQAVALAPISPGVARAACSTTTIPAGEHTISATYGGSGTYSGITSSGLAQTVTPAVYVPGPNPPRLGNLSTRGQVLTGFDVMIGGFIIGGPSPKTIVVTTTGPSLAAFGITNALANPTLTVVRASDQAVIGVNDDWASAPNAAQIQASGFAPAHALESAYMATLAPGAYTAIVSGAGGGTGVGLVAIYEVDQPEVPLVNVSTRGRVGTGADVLIGGFVIQGNGPQTVVVRASGPSLAAYGIANPLANPSLTLVRADGTVVDTNDDWGSAATAAQLQAMGLAPAHPLDSAILVTLPPGAYTGIVSGVGGATGVGTVEVYRVP